MNYGQRLSFFFKGNAWDYVKKYPVKVGASVTAGIILCSSPIVFSVERFLLKSRIHFGCFVSNDEKFQGGRFKETSSSKLLKTIISPEVQANSYYIITGEDGIGKSSASTHIADELGHSGIVYIKVPQSGDPKEFEKSLAQRLFLYHMIYDKIFSYLAYLPLFAGMAGMILLDFPDYDGDKKESYLTILMDKLCVLSHQYKRWHEGKGLVLVIDQVDHFLAKVENGKSHEYYLDILQNFAKDLADSKEIKIVFISNGGDAYARMMNRSAISRAHVVEFQEATVAEAFDFLKDRLGEAKFNEKKDELVDLVKTYTGGKFQTLVDVAKGVGDLKGKMCQLREDAKNHLQTFWMHHPDEKLKQEMKDKEKKDEERRKAKKALVLKDIGNHVVKNGKIDRRLLIIKLSGRMKEEELRRMNIFAYHHSTNSYSFATPALKTVYQEIATAKDEEAPAK